MTATLLADGPFAEWLPAATSPSGPDFVATWTADLLRWRLARRRTDYVLHVLDEALLVSTRTRMAGVPIGVLLKVIPRRPPEHPLRSGPLVAAVGEHHRTPFIVHAGTNPAVRLRGIPLPRRLMPSPLEVVLHPLHPGFDADALELGGFEFLDFDAY